jgi:hypothetical protein
MRKAIIVELKEITEFNSRVYQAFLAPLGAITPYCTVAFGEDIPTVYNKKGSVLHFEVYIYINPSTYVTLDDLVTKIKLKLDKAAITTDESPARIFRPEYERTLRDYTTEEGLIMKTVYFNIPLSRT